MGQKLSVVGIVVLLLLSVAGVAVGAGTFSDDDGNIHEANIEYIAALGVTKGCNPPANTLYCPSDLVSRGQMAAFLRRALNLPFTNQDFFSDDNGSTFEKDINALANAGITKGCNPPANTSYCPDGTVTRGQMAAFLVRGFGYTDNGGGDLFVDDDNSVFENDIDKLGTAGVTKGCNPPTNDRYCPNDFVRRDAMASFLARAIQGTGGSSALGASPASLDFGAVLTDEVDAKGVTLTNLGSSGDAPIRITAASISGPDAGEFSHNLSLPRVINPGGSVVVTITHDAGIAGFKSATLNLTHNGSNSPLTINLAATDVLGVEYRVNAGGPQVTDSPLDWEDDDDPTPAPYLAAGGNQTFSTTASIDLNDPSVPAGTPEQLFQTERYDPNGGSEMAWAFPVTNGAYRVNLYFAEIFGDVGREFDVSIEGSTVLNDLNVVDEVGLNAGLVTTHDLAVSDGQLNIVFIHQVENPAIKAIEVLSLGGQPGVLSVAPTSVDFQDVLQNDTDTEEVVLTNLGQPGDPNINISNVAASGPFTPDLPLSDSVLSPGESVTVGILHTGGSPGPKSGTLTVTHNGANSPSTVNLSANDVGAGAQDASAYVAVTLNGDINASTYDNGQIYVQNTSDGGVEIESVLFNLTGSVVSDAVFDPNGGAGDNLGKPFTANSGAAQTGLVTSAPGGARDGGFDTLSVTFDDFEPGEVFTFSIDIDPTSIKGSVQPGPNDSGSVSGLELSGATVTVEFSDGSSLDGNLFGSAGNHRGDVYLKSGAPAAPTIAFDGEPAVTTVTDASQTVQVTGTPNADVVLLRVEFGLFLAGVPGGGYDIDPGGDVNGMTFPWPEVNSAVALQQYAATLDGTGVADIPVTLTNQGPDAYNMFIAVELDSDDEHTNTSNILFADYNP